MADSDHWVLYHSASRVCLCVRIFHIRPKLRVRLEEQPASHQSSFRHYTTWLNFLPVRGSFPNPCTVNPNLHPPCGCLPNRRSSFLTAGKKKRGQTTGTGRQRFRGRQPVFCCCLNEESEDERWNKEEWTNTGLQSKISSMTPRKRVWIQLEKDCDSFTHSHSCSMLKPCCHQQENPLKEYYRTCHNEEPLNHYKLTLKHHSHPKSLYKSLYKQHIQQNHRSTKRVTMKLP